MRVLNEYVVYVAYLGKTRDKVVCFFRFVDFSFSSAVVEKCVSTLLVVVFFVFFGILSLYNGSWFE